MPAGSSAAGVLSDEFFPPSAAAAAANSSSGLHQDLDPEFKRKLESWERIRSSSGVGKKNSFKSDQIEWQK